MYVALASSSLASSRDTTRNAIVIVIVARDGLATCTSRLRCIIACIVRMKTQRSNVTDRTAGLVALLSSTPKPQAPRGQQHANPAPVLRATRPSASLAAGTTLLLLATPPRHGSIVSRARPPAAHASETRSSLRRAHVVSVRTRRDGAGRVTRRERAGARWCVHVGMRARVCVCV